MFAVPSNERLRRAEEWFQTVYDPGLDPGPGKKIALKDIIGETGKIRTQILY